MKTPRISALVGITSDGRGTITFQFKSADGRSHYLPMDHGVLNAMVGPILSAKSEILDSKGHTVEHQLLTLTEGRTMVLEDGRPGLELHLDGIPLRIGLTRQSLSTLQRMLEQLADSTSLQPKGPKH